MTADAYPETPALKVCGVTTTADARAIADLGVELVGLNFYHGSPRCLDAERAAEVRSALGENVLVVGVFVDAPLQVVRDIGSRVGLDLFQFHGNEPEAVWHPVAERAIRVLRGVVERDPPVDPFAACWGLLFDTPTELLGGEIGGSGKTWRYEAAAPCIASSPGRRILVAGGISPANAGAVLERLPGVWGLDVCSGVESAPGRKDLDKVAALLDAVRSFAAGSAATRPAPAIGEPG
ncbi:MAG TPA: phosphoribosylanthranilate isomerase [Thermoanaerobaculia bacterium]|nr:phosphoribosylanthranilate isomerase [Thermoanaerobaculia bacterium]